VPLEADWPSTLKLAGALHFLRLLVQDEATNLFPELARRYMPLFVEHFEPMHDCPKRVQVPLCGAFEPGKISREGLQHKLQLGAQRLVINNPNNAYLLIEIIQMILNKVSVFNLIRSPTLKSLYLVTHSRNMSLPVKFCVQSSFSFENLTAVPIDMPGNVLIVCIHE
jgi:hypothetical protein